MRWEWVRLSDCCTIASGATPRREVPKYWNGDIPWVTPKDISNLNSKYLDRVPEFISEEGYKSCSTEVIPTGSLLFSSRAPIGLLAINTFPVCTNQGFKPLIPHRDKLDVEFLYYYFFYSKVNIQALGRGATFKEVSKSIISDLQIPLPPLTEQRRIASILDRADALRRKDRALLEQYERLGKAVFWEMFGDPVRWGKDWKMEKISSLAKKEKNSLRTGPFGSDLLHSEFVEEGIYVLGIDNVVSNRFEWAKSRFITEEKYRKLNRYTVFPGDILITIMGTTGRVAVVPQSIPLAINSKHLAALTLDQSKINPYYVWRSFLWDPRVIMQLRSKGRGAIMEGLNLGIIKNVEVLVPPKNVQDQFSSILEKIEGMNKKIEVQIQNSTALFHSLLHRAFRGEL